MSKVTDYHRQLIEDARNYPLALRIAQILVKDGIDERTAIQQLSGRNPLENEIINNIGNIERGHFLHGQDQKRLKKLAEQFR